MPISRRSLLAAATVGAAALALSPAPPASAGTGPVPFGLTVPWGPFDVPAWSARAAALRAAPAYALWYASFTEAPDPAKLAAVAATGAVPVLTWEPWDPARKNQKAFALARFLAGDHDATIRRWGDALAAYGGPVHLRFAHEMNAGGYPCAVGVGGNTAGQYVAVWRRVHDLLRSRGATRVVRVWSPNVSFPGSTPIASVYPGAQHVDVVGVDGYNWGTARRGSVWQSPSQVFGPTVAELRRVAPGKPLLLAETASTEKGGDKARWVTELFGWAALQGDLAGLVWFDENKETDWRIASSAASLAAFRAAVAPR
ncbi:glycosyl hydrolase [Cellulomonas sp. IC4_254]|uniref:glycoside hydrolase family 26 protein n=1 Tax=Cellulomonas sp. IC4_254 TaxID=2714040 RepID=UPI00141F232C|nr:glycosyl hydrolase [Cellulomonas sp. IC4_254]NHT16499.1 twin-arginine translocation signal domain-containing protein [Cellulomonas sp. IC4_254]